jgi:putative transposase
VAVVLDWYTKVTVGYYAGLRGTSKHWLAALDMAINRQFPDGVREQGLSLMSDNGCQPTSQAFMEACSTLGIRQHSPPADANSANMGSGSFDHPAT